MCSTRKVTVRPRPLGIVVIVMRAIPVSPAISTSARPTSDTPKVLICHTPRRLIGGCTRRGQYYGCTRLH